MMIIDHKIFVLFLFVFFASISFIIPICRRIALLLLYVDDPDKSERKIHMENTPYLGGIGIYGGFILGMVFFVFFFREICDFAFLQLLAIYLLGGLLILAVGTADDIHDLSARNKLYAQIAVVIMVYFGGIGLEHMPIPHWGIVEFGGLSLIVTAVVIVATMNAVNLIDGLDGLAASVVLISIGSNALLSLHLNLNFNFVIAVILMASILGFLKYNWTPAKIFLGDGGSLLLGYLISILGIQNINASNSFAEAFLPFMALFYPIVDLMNTIVRRLIKGRPMMSADRAHLHHKLFEMGMKHSEVTAIVIVFSLLPSAAGFMFVYNLPLWGFISVTLSFVLLLVIFLISGHLSLGAISFNIKMRPIYKAYYAHKKKAIGDLKYAKNEGKIRDILLNVGTGYNIHFLKWNNFNIIDRRKDNCDTVDMGIRTIKMVRSRGSLEYVPPDLENDELSCEVDGLINTIATAVDLSVAKLGSTGQSYHDCR